MLKIAKHTVHVALFANSLSGPPDSDRGCVVPDQPQHVLRVRLLYPLRLVFDSATVNQFAVRRTEARNSSEKSAGHCSTSLFRGQIILPIRVNNGVELVTLDEVAQIADDSLARNFEVARQLRYICPVIAAAQAFQ